MFIAVLFLIAQIWKQPRYPSQPEHPYHGILSDNKKEWTVDTSNNLNQFPKNYNEKKANPKRLHTILFHLYNIYEIIKKQKRY